MSYYDYESQAWTDEENSGMRKRCTYIVAVFDCAQQYGGHEEGGWWYDSGSLVRIIRVFKNDDHAYAYARRLNYKLRSRSFGPNCGKREYTSVISEGEIRAYVYEDKVPNWFPEYRPHYE